MLWTIIRLSLSHIEAIQISKRKTQKILKEETKMEIFKELIIF